MENNSNVTIVEQPLMEKGKAIWQSRTFWLNVLGVVVGVGGILLNQMEAGVVITAMGFINIVLRVMTTKGILLNK